MTQTEVGFTRLSPLDLLDLLPESLVVSGFSASESWVLLQKRDHGEGGQVKVHFLSNPTSGLKVLDSSSSDEVTHALLELFESKEDHGPESAKLHSSAEADA